MRRIVFFLFVLSFTVQCVYAQQITGVVKDQKGNPVPAASVKLKNAQTGTTTDSLGMFHFNAPYKSVLVISAIGFREREITVKEDYISIVLKQQDKALNDVTVKSMQKTNASRTTDPVLTSQAVAQDFHDYTATQNINNGPHVIEYNSGNSSKDAVHFVSLAPSGTIYNGAAFPTFTHKEETKGSRYFFNKWVKGQVITSEDSLFDSRLFVFNYDKITKNLLLTQDMKSMVEVDKAQYKAFTLDDGEKQYQFARIPSVDPKNVVQVLVDGKGKYSLYKKTDTRFKKANYITTGLTESGNNYDEYIDEATYYVSFPDGKLRQIELKRKAIKQWFDGIPKAAEFLKEYRYNIINEDYLQGLVEFLNQ